jgi:chromosomal replication initiator protein
LEKWLVVGTAGGGNLIEFGFRFWVILALVREPFSWALFEPLGVTDGAVEQVDVSAISLLDGPDSKASADRASGFIAGPENRLARAVVDWLLSDAPVAYSTIVICGPSGTGKTHLARGIACARSGGIYVTASDFARELNEAVRGHRMLEFRAMYRAATVLVLDDLTHLENYPSAIDEFVRVLDDFELREAPVVVASRKSPDEISAFPSGLQSRLSGGLFVPLSPPSVEARKMILERTALANEVTISSDALALLAERLSGTAPALRGALLELRMDVAEANSASKRQGAEAIDVADVRDYLHRRQNERRPAIKEVAVIVAKCFGLKPSELSGASRRQQVVLARSMAIYLGRILSGASLKSLGQYFGKRDHSTALHSCRKFEARLSHDQELRGTVEMVRELLGVA